MSSSSTEREAPSRRQLVSFGVTMALALAILAALRTWRRGFDPIAIGVLIVAALFALTAALAPRALHLLHRWWMRLAEALGWINTRILLILIFYLVVTPLGVVMRLFRRAPLDMAQRDSYWTDPPPNSYGDRHYEKQF